MRSCAAWLMIPVVMFGAGAIAAGEPPSPTPIPKVTDVNSPGRSPLDVSGARVKIGDAAPPLAEADLLKGDPVEAYKAGTVYVVYFQCEMMHCDGIQGPHQITLLNDLQTVIGSPTVRVIHVQTTQRAKGQPPEWSETSVRDDPCLHLTLFSDPKSVVRKAFCSQRLESPWVFVIDGRGNVAWISHELTDVATVVRRVSAGTLDASVLQDQLQQWTVLQERYHTESSANDKDKASQTLDAMQAVAPHRGAIVARYRLAARSSIADHCAAAHQLATELVAGEFSEDRALLERIAELGWFERSWDASAGDSLVQQALQKVVEMDRYCDWITLERLAASFAGQKDWTRAIEYQQYAVNAAQQRGSDARKLTETLEDYRASRDGVDKLSPAFRDLKQK